MNGLRPRGTASVGSPTRTWKRGLQTAVATSSRETVTRSPTTSPQAGGDVLLRGVPARALLRSGFRLEVWDFDLATPDDRILVCVPDLTEASFADGARFQVECPSRTSDEPFGPTVAGSVVFRLRQSGV